MSTVAGICLEMMITPGRGEQHERLNLPIHDPTVNYAKTLRGIRRQRCAFLNTVVTGRGTTTSGSPARTW